MRGAERCDEIVRLIDEVLGEASGLAAATVCAADRSTGLSKRSGPAPGATRLARRDRTRSTVNV